MLQSVTCTRNCIEKSFAVDCAFKVIYYGMHFGGGFFIVHLTERKKNRQFWIDSHVSVCFVTWIVCILRANIY